MVLMGATMLGITVLVTAAAFITLTCRVLMTGPYLRHRTALHQTDHREQTPS
jgi:hypothetical protein